MSAAVIVVLVIFVAILLSLAVALYHLVTGAKGDKRSMVRALTVRVSLSVFLVILLFLAWKAGWIEPHALGG